MNEKQPEGDLWLNEQFLVEMRLDRARIPSFDAYPFSLNAIKNLESLPLHRSVTFIIGENGSGKSTLLEALAVAWGFNAEERGGALPDDARFSQQPSNDA